MASGSPASDGGYNSRKRSAFSVWLSGPGLRITRERLVQPVETAVFLWPGWSYASARGGIGSLCGCLAARVWGARGSRRPLAQNRTYPNSPRRNRTFSCVWYVAPPSWWL
ncbi:MAG: hypothetical protein RLZZ387_2005 [Chloroflexota bacterium]